MNNSQIIAITFQNSCFAYIIIVVMVIVIVIIIIILIIIMIIIKITINFLLSLLLILSLLLSSLLFLFCFVHCRTKELDASFVGHLEGTIRLNDDQGVLELGNLSQKYIDDPDLREILAKTALDAKIMHSFTDGDKLLLITEVIYSGKFEMKRGKQWKVSINKAMMK